MEVLVGSVSGGNFPYQLSALIRLCCHQYKPELSLGGSGGTVAIYCALAADWNPSGIERVSRGLNSALFIDKRSSTLHQVVPECVSSYYHGSMYKSSSNSGKLLDTYFDEDKICSHEVWVAAINEGEGSVALFCNRDRDDAIVKGSYLNRKLHNYEPIKYYSGDKNKIAKSIVATSSIPMFIQPVEIDGNYYTDCGVKYGSALTPLSNEILAIARTRGVHIVYLAGYDVLSPSRVNENIRTGTGNMSHHLGAVPRHMVRSFVELDRKCAYDIVRDECDTEPHYREFSIDELGKCLKLKRKCKTSLIEIYPSSEESINVFKFTGDDVVQFIHTCTPVLKIRMWYVLRP